MNISKRLTSMAAVVSIANAASVFAGRKEAVRVFHDFLSNPVPSGIALEFENTTRENWESVGIHSGKS